MMTSFAKVGVAELMRPVQSPDPNPNNYLWDELRHRILMILELNVNKSPQPCSNILRNNFLEEWRLLYHQRGSKTIWGKQQGHVIVIGQVSTYFRPNIVVYIFVILCEYVKCQGTPLTVRLGIQVLVPLSSQCWAVYQSQVFYYCIKCVRYM